MKVRLSEFSEDWIRLFQEEAHFLKAIFNDEIVRVEHFGSTSVPRMKAKPVIHLLVECTPQHSISGMIKALKGVSARLLFKEFPEIKKRLWGGHLWNPSYFVATVSEHTEAQIRTYIQNQKVK